MDTLAKKALYALLLMFTARMKITGPLDQWDKKIITLCDPIKWG